MCIGSIVVRPGHFCAARRQGISGIGENRRRDTASGQYDDFPTRFHYVPRPAARGARKGARRGSEKAIGRKETAHLSADYFSVLTAANCWK
ncbi:hypothetical protein [Sodalis sp. dw_96]|uniref:hypothetical protein n=1 Tax=Sodalis sp. dw_96 TaxID=2719794 RepID=UPI001BD3DD04|nr:hypothetical protein [Sodalis sp. dw_96]